MIIAAKLQALGRSSDIRMPSRAVKYALACAALVLNLSAPLSSAFAVDDEKLLDQEHQLLERFPQLGARHKNRLTISVEAGASLVFDSTPDSCDGLASTSDCLLYRLDSYDAANDVLTIWVFGWESVGTIFVDRQNGARLDLGSEPVVSPDGQTWAVVTENYMYNDYSIEIVRRSHGKIERAARFTNRMPCVFEQWRTASAFTVVCLDWDAPPLAGTYPSVERIAERNSAGNWVVSATGRKLPNNAYDQIERQIQGPF